MVVGARNGVTSGTTCIMPPAPPPKIWQLFEPHSADVKPLMLKAWRWMVWNFTRCRCIGWKSPVVLMMSQRSNVPFFGVSVTLYSNGTPLICRPSEVSVTGSIRSLR